MTGSPAPDSSDVIVVDLREPRLAALLAWLIPGAGHFYQRRYTKGLIFLICILTTYFAGLTLGGGQVVYASWVQNDVRWQYICQLGVGIPALPALVQTYRVNHGKAPLFADAQGDAWMMPPARPVLVDRHDQLAQWHLDYHQFFELGTLYTMIAGLLNVLAIYDAYAGPLSSPTGSIPTGPPPGRDSRKPKPS